MKNLTGLVDRLASSLSDVIDALQDLEAAGLRLGNDEPLIRALRANDYYIEALHDAAALLDADTPMYAHWPDGTEPIAPFTPEQVFALTSKRKVSEVLTGSQLGAIQKAVDAVIGPTQKAVCTGTTKAGWACAGWALKFGTEKRCSAHASAGDKAQNKAKLTSRASLWASVVRDLSAGEDPFAPGGLLHDQPRPSILPDPLPALAPEDLSHKDAPE